MTHIALTIVNNLPIYLLQEDQPGGGISGWVWVIIILFIVLLVAWRLISNRGREDFPLSEHGEPSEHRIEAQPLIQEQPQDTASERIDEVLASDMESSRVPMGVQTAAPTPPVTSADNLVVIEGIGPKIASVLEANGITTFAQLADTPVQHLKQILEREGLRLADPTTWPEQARLAATGDWDGLTALQGRLKAGRQE